MQGAFSLGSRGRTSFAGLVSLSRPAFLRGIKDIFICVAEQMLKCCHVLTLFGVGYAWF